MSKEFKVTIDLVAKKDISISDIQREFRKFIFDNETIKSASIKTSVKVRD